MQLFSLVGSQFLLCYALLNQKLHEGQRQTIDELTDDEITDLGTQTVKFAKNGFVSPRLLGNYKVDTDECDKQIGSYILQMQWDGTNWPIGYRSRLLKDAKRAYETSRHECLAVVWAVLLPRQGGMKAYRRH